MEKEILTGAAIILSFGNYAFYIYRIFKGEFRPHAFSWLIWALLTYISVAAQIHEQAGPAIFAMAFNGTGCLFIAVLALSRGERTITRSDWAAFLAGLAAIPVWLATDDPLYSVIIITTIDAVGLWPTIRKSWDAPWQESARMFFIGALIFLLSLGGIDNFTWTTALYPAAIIVINMTFIAILLIRRRQLPKALTA